MLTYADVCADASHNIKIADFGLSNMIKDGGFLKVIAFNCLQLLATVFNCLSCRLKRTNLICPLNRHWQYCAFLQDLVAGVC